MDSQYLDHFGSVNNGKTLNCIELISDWDCWNSKNTTINDWPTLSSYTKLTTVTAKH